MSRRPSTLEQRINIPCKKRAGTDQPGTCRHSADRSSWSIQRSEGTLSGRPDKGSQTPSIYAEVQVALDARMQGFPEGEVSLRWRRRDPIVSGIFIQPREQGKYREGSARMSCSGSGWSLGVEVDT